jgi:hypothetical protein
MKYRQNNELFSADAKENEIGKSPNAYTPHILNYSMKARRSFASFLQSVFDLGNEFGAETDSVGLVPDDRFIIFKTCSFPKSGP